MKNRLSDILKTNHLWLAAALVLVALSLEINAQKVLQLPTPAGEGSGQSFLTTGRDGRVYLSWIERLENKRFALRFSAKERDGWSRPQTIAEGGDWVVNWANFPSIVALPDGSLAAHWLTSGGGGPYTSDIRISRSFDGGRTWSPGVVPHRDGTQTEHGFVSMFPGARGALEAIWLDGREMKKEAGGHGHGHGEMTLRHTSLGRVDAQGADSLLDARVCECCQTSAAMTSDGPIVVYRDRSADEMRDIAIVRLGRDGRWSAPRLVHADGWKLDGCPINGPSVDAANRRVAVAWFTMAGGAPHVRVAFSKDAGATFGAPVKADDGDPVGRVDVLALEDGGAIVSWIEKTKEGSAELRVRRVWADGRRGESVTVAPSGEARSSGFPQMARSKNSLIFSWTGTSRVLTAETTVPAR
ncbi:MAG TPA: sialidase family protein [Pyrinomonadaceae bacterium]|nr:sialidase family protein [Pyrinomonadaceae bacterium]